MTIISKHKVEHFLHLCDNGSTNEARGKALEDLICYIFEKIPGMIVNARDHMDFATCQEIDIALWNEKCVFLPTVVFIECKNWVAPVSSNELRGFEVKLRDSGQTFGILVAMNGITGDPQQLTSAHNIIASALSHGIRIVVFTRADITAAGSSNEIVEAIKKKLCQLAVHRTCL
jgi:hypothetical protein